MKLRLDTITLRAIHSPPFFWSLSGLGLPDTHRQNTLRTPELSRRRGGIGVLNVFDLRVDGLPMQSAPKMPLGRRYDRVWRCAAAIHTTLAA